MPFIYVPFPGQPRLPQELIEQCLQQHLRTAYEQQQETQQQQADVLGGEGASSLHNERLPTIALSDLGRSAAFIEVFELTCKHGPLGDVKLIIEANNSLSPYFLHKGLASALQTGNLEIARLLLSTGAPIVFATPQSVLRAPLEKQLSLFELLSQYGWSPNPTPPDEVPYLLPLVLHNKPLVAWFLEHGVDVVGEASEGVFEQAACDCDVETVRMLLDAGAVIQESGAMHAAAGACPPGVKLFDENISPTREFDEGRIPILELLVERGADVNQAMISRYRIPKYPIVHAVMAGAVQRVKWLLERGADPEKRGQFGSAISVAIARSSTEEMRRVLGMAED